MVSALFSCATTPDNAAPGGIAGSANAGHLAGAPGSAGTSTSGTAGSTTSFAGAVNFAGASGSPQLSSGGASGASNTAGAAHGGSFASGGSGGRGGAGNAAGSGGKASSGGSGGMSGGGQGGSATVPDPPRLTDGTQGWATRYWDCCKPACGWPQNVGGRTPIQSCTQDDQPLSDTKAKNACESGGVAYMCHALEPWAVSATLSYGYAAVNKGSDYCGKCYQLQFTGGSHNSNVDAGSKALVGKTMIVQAINNGGVDANQFDLLVPGGGVGLLDACSKQWGTKDLGEQYGGFFLKCQKDNNFDYEKSKACAKAKCDSVFANKPELRTGCEWFTDWFGAPDNPAVLYKEVTCPDAITKNSGLKR